MGSQIGKQIWREPGFWENITYYLLHRRKFEEYQKALSTQSTSANSSTDIERDEKKTEGKSLMQGIRKKLEVLMETNKSPKIDEDSLKALIMDEVNTYVSRLKLDQRTRAYVLVDIAKKLIFDKSFI